MYERGSIHRISRGYYSFYDEVQFVGFAFFPFYYGLEDALSLLNLREQETNPVVITPRAVRSGVRTYLDRNYIVRRIDRSMFFGYRYIKYDKFYVPVSDPEKTLIDILYFGVPVGTRTLDEIISNINVDKLKNYLLDVPDGTNKRVLKALDRYGENKENTHS